MTKLEEIIKKHLGEVRMYEYEIKQAMIEYVKLCLEKAAEEAEVCTYYVDDEGEERNSYRTKNLWR